MAGLTAQIIVKLLNDTFISAVTFTVVSPLDRVSTLQHLYPILPADEKLHKSQLSTVTEPLSEIVEEHGAKALFYGNVCAIAEEVVKGVCFATQLVVISNIMRLPEATTEEERQMNVIIGSATYIFSSATSILASYPFGLVRRRLQRTVPLYDNIFDAFVKIPAKEGGITALWRGAWKNFLVLILDRIVSNIAKEMVSSVLPVKSELTKEMIAVFLGSCCATVILNPLKMHVKCIQARVEDDPSESSLKSIKKAVGIGGLFWVGVPSALAGLFVTIAATYASAKIATSLSNTVLGAAGAQFALAYRTNM
eukprot:TRINITY_DN12497_c0_g1_i1.p1 TRINITY_DN12497_c0_g1~~TRINITY_DN12497_c0_g1_i1.p1  ORF type:complete len:318 (-),score=37.02 TRINITY_DN12497_c0_g1_i1:61-987(-)